MDLAREVLKAMLQELVARCCYYCHRLSRYGSQVKRVSLLNYGQKVAVVSLVKAQVVNLLVCLAESC